jgi:23S rRNA pseudouridine2605 synthase
LLAVVPERIHVEIDGMSERRAAWTLIVLNKPRGVVTTRRDPDGRRTVYDVLATLAGASRLVPVGRLDMATTGLLLLTNDTRLADWLTNPRHAIVRRYVVTVRGQLADDEAAAITRGLDVGAPRSGSMRLAAHSLTLLKRSRRETHLIVELTEGRNREIRRLMSAVGHDVTKLKRIAFGGLELGDLAPGAWRAVDRDEFEHAFPQANRTGRRRGRG